MTNTERVPHEPVYIDEFPWRRHDPVYILDRVGDHIEAWWPIPEVMGTDLTGHPSEHILQAQERVIRVALEKRGTLTSELYERAKASPDVVRNHVPAVKYLDRLEADWRESLDTNTVNSAVAIERVPHRLVIENEQGQFVIVHVRR